MGIHTLFSSSSIGEPSRNMLGRKSWSKFDESSNSALNLPNPNPANYKIVRYIGNENYLIVEIKYLDCTNYEGRKILVFENVTMGELEQQKLIDPHFSDNKEYHSPIARFEPTERGLEMAISFIENYGK